MNKASPLTSIAMTLIVIAPAASLSAQEHQAAVAYDQTRVRQLAVAWNDAESGVGFVQAMETTQPWQFQTPPLPVGRDPVLRFARGRLFVLSKHDGTLRIVDADNWSVLREISLGADSKPLDIAVINSRRAYVTRQDATHLVRLNLVTGAMADVVDLGRFADAGQPPDLGMLARAQGKLFVQIRRFNVRPALLAVVDLVTEELIDVDPGTPAVDAIMLAGRAPKFKMQRLRDNLLLSATGGFFDDGGLELVNVVTLRSLGLVVRETDGQVGSDLGAFTMVAANRGYLTYSTDLLTSSHLHAFTPNGEVEITEFHTSLSYFVPRLVFDSATGTLFYPEGGWAPPGVHVFDAQTGEKLTREPTPITGSLTDMEFISVSGGGLVR